MESTPASARTRPRRLLLLPLAIATVALAACAPPPTPDPTTPWIAPGCIDSSVPGVPDFRFNGIADQFENATAFFVDEEGTYADDGSCTGSFGEERGSIVRAADSQGAIDVCTEVGVADITDPARLVDFGYEAPIDAWTCVNQPAV